MVMFVLLWENKAIHHHESPGQLWHSPLWSWTTHGSGDYMCLAGWIGRTHILWCSQLDPGFLLAYDWSLWYLSRIVLQLNCVLLDCSADSYIIMIIGESVILDGSLKLKYPYLHEMPENTSNYVYCYPPLSKQASNIRCPFFGLPE